MAKITLPYILQNHNNADGGQVQDDLNAILAQVNGNLDGENVGNGTISLPKLGSDVKTIEAIYHDEKHTNFPGSGSDAVVDLNDGTLTTIFSQAMTLSAARYCLINISLGVSYWADSYDSVDFTVLDGDTELHAIRQAGIAGVASPMNFNFLTQLASGSHTIYFKGKYASGGGSGTSISVYDRAFTIIQFAF